MKTYTELDYRLYMKVVDDYIDRYGAEAIEKYGIDADKVKSLSYEQWVDWQCGKVKLHINYKKYVEHWGDPIDPINYKLYSIETDMPCFHPDNRLFTKEEFRDLRDSNESFRKMWELK